MCVQLICTPIARENKENEHMFKEEAEKHTQEQLKLIALEYTLSEACNSKQKHMHQHTHTILENRKAPAPYSMHIQKLDHQW